MAKKVIAGSLKLQVKAGQANPSPPDRAPPWVSAASTSCSSARTSTRKTRRSMEPGAPTFRW
jgi:hypothetical protein